MFALEGLAPVDGWVIAAIVAKALWYGAALLAIGGVMFVALFRHDDRDLAHFARRMSAIAALAMLVLLALGFAIQAARISGMGFGGMVEPMMLGVVWESPLGRLAVWQCVGAALVLLLAVSNRTGGLLALGGAVIIALSFAQVGHSLGERPLENLRWALVSLLAVHLLAVSFWIGALLPLHRAAAYVTRAPLLHRFGVVAGWVVPLLLVAGITFAWLISGSLAALFSTAYGWTLIAKVLFVSTLLALAAANKLRLVPDLAANRIGAAAALRRSIRLEGALVGLILLATAALTTITTPPVNL